MSIELSRDASLLLEDIELELASIRAAMALRPLEGGHADLPAAHISAPPAEPGIPRIGPFDLSRSGAEAAPPVPVAENAAEQPKRMTLQQRLASLRDTE